MTMHQTLPDAYSGIHDATSHACWVDGAPCEVVAPFLPRLHAITGEAWEATLAPYTGCLPCARCRAAGQVAARLPGQRLGRQARTILLRAADAAEGAVVAEEGITRAEQEARLRAARSLNALGLIVRGWETRKRTVERPARRWWFTDGQGKRVAVRSEKTWPKRESYSLLTARLTPFGEALVAVYRDDLETGKPIRWDHRVATALAACRQSPEELLTTFTVTVTGRMDGALWVAGIQSRIGMLQKARENKDEYDKGKVILDAIAGGGNNVFVEGNKNA